MYFDADNALKRNDLRAIYEGCGGSQDPRRFVKAMYQMIGLTDANGRRRSGSDGAYRVQESVTNKSGQTTPRLKPKDISLKCLAEALLGEEGIERHLRPNVTRQVLEATGEGAVGASAFANINAWTGVTAGLLEVSVMEGWQLPEFIGEQLMPDVPTKMFEGRKVIGTTRLGDAAEERIPGMPTKRAQIGERWVTQPRTVENALAAEVTQEAAFLDISGTVYENAQDVGTWCRYRKELRQLNAFLGITNTYSYKGNSYNTYITGGYFNNDVTGNDLQHWTNLQTIFIMFRDMIDPETNTRVVINPNTLLVNQEKLFTAQAIIGATQVQYRDAPGSTTNPQQVREFPNPVAGRLNVLTSPLVYQRCTDTDGLNLSPTVAGGLYFVFEAGKPMVYATNWPMRVQTAAPNQLDMIDRGVVLYIKADERGVPMVMEPRRIVRSRA